MSSDKNYGIESRRKLLKVLSGAITTATGLSAVSGNALAGDGSDVSVGDDQVIATSPAGGGATDDEWEVSFDELDSQVYLDLLWFTNPGELPLDICEELENGNEFCAKTADVYQEGYRDCFSGQTPKVYSIDITLQEWESGSTRAELDMWIGLDDYFCLWVGQEDTAICAGDLSCHMEEKYEAMFSDPETWVDAGQTVGEWVKDNEEDLIDGAAKLTEAAIYGLVLVAIIIVITLINLVTGANS